ncbi:MAG: hypothetical protein ABI224_14295 [Acetobacteraceae bacterium]
MDAMDFLGPIVFGVLAVSAGACALAVRDGWLRAASFCLTLALAGALWQTSLGRPRLPLFDTPSGTVVSFRFDEPRAIYLWMLAPGERTPTAFALPWSERQAAELQQAAEQARQQGEPLQAKPTGRRAPIGLHLTAQEGVRFYPAEHVALPPKAVPTE